MGITLSEVAAIEGAILLPGHNPAESRVHLTYTDRNNTRTLLPIPLLLAMQLLQELERVRSENGFALPK
jgi:hypothetical protein